MVQDGIELAKSVIELGFLAAAAIIVLALLVWHQWRIVPMMGALLYSSQRLIESADKLAEDLQLHHVSTANVITKAEDMHDTCRDHGDLLREMEKSMQEFRQRLIDRLGKVEQELAVLKTSVYQHRRADD